MARSNGSTQSAPIEIPPPDAPSDIDKYSRFIVTDFITTTTGAAATCAIGTPGKTRFFRTHPDPGFYLHLSCLVHEEGGKRRTYLILPEFSALPELEGLTKVVRTVPWIDHYGSLGIWPISIEHDDNPWIKSALNAVAEAKTRWLAAIAVTKQSQYRKQYSATDYGEPNWPDLTMVGWLDLAFTAEAWITERDHPVLKKIRGE